MSSAVAEGIDSILSVACVSIMVGGCWRYFSLHGHLGTHDPSSVSVVDIVWAKSADQSVQVWNKQSSQCNCPTYC